MVAPAVHPGEPPRTGTCLFSNTYASRIDRKQAIIDEIAAQFEQHRLVPPEDLQWLHLCLDEVVVNAMLHGNEGDPDLLISVALYRDGGRWSLIVSDQGEGFDPGTVPDTDDPDTLLLEHGRGIRIMREWLDELAFYRHGATAVLIRRIAAPGAT